MLAEIPPPAGENAGVRDDAVYHRREFKLYNRQLVGKAGNRDRRGTGDNQAKPEGRSDRGAAAIDRELCAVDVTCAICCQKNNCLGNLVGCGRAARRSLCG